MAWIDEISDPSEVVPAELYEALQALALLITSLEAATGIAFDYDIFFSDAVDNVDEALKEIGEYLDATAVNRELMGDFTAAALVDATTYFNFLMTRDRVLGIVVLRVLTTPPAGGSLTINVLQNGSLIETLEIEDGASGYVYKDLSHTAVAIGDIISIAVVLAKGAVGLACTLEV